MLWLEAHLADRAKEASSDKAVVRCQEANESHAPGDGRELLHSCERKHVRTQLLSSRTMVIRSFTWGVTGLLPSAQWVYTLRNLSTVSNLLVHLQ